MGFYDGLMVIEWDLPSGKRLHNEKENQHAING